MHKGFLFPLIQRTALLDNLSGSGCGSGKIKVHRTRLVNAH